MTKDEALRALRRAELECAIARGKLAQAELHKQQAEENYLEAEYKVERAKQQVERHNGGVSRGLRGI